MVPFEVAVHPIGTAPVCKYTVALTLDGRRVLLSRHRDRDTWETQGGHVEPGESVEAAAERELYEESGVIPASLRPVCDYWASDAVSGAWGRCFVATVDRIDLLPDSEMAETRWFDELPDEELLSYPWITPLLYRTALGE